MHYSHKQVCLPIRACSSFLRSLSFRAILCFFTAYIMLYHDHLSYAEGLIDGLGMMAINWGSVYSSIGVFSFLLGIVIARLCNMQGGGRSVG